MKRKIIKINEEKCTGCGLCVEACHEKAIEIVNGKARLVSDEYCDGLGACLPACPEAAIEIVETEAKPFDEEAVKERLKKLKTVCACAGASEREILRPHLKKEQIQDSGEPSQLRNWPIQMKLINPKARFLEDAELLIAADCTAFAYASFHRDFIKDKVTLIGCPKLDETDLYYEKLVEIFKTQPIRSVTVVRMEVPCCGGIVSLVKEAINDAGISIPVREEIITITGEVKQKDVSHAL